MEAEQWQDMWSAFHRALDLEEDERVRYLESLDDPLLRGEIESLLAAHREETAVLAGSAPRGDQAESPSLVGRRAGSYRVVREIGHGGMGTVYLAERGDQQYDHKVAIKVVRRGMDTAEILARFRQERQILANLDHSNIARLLDGGTTDDGLPFFVMEHIEGEPIDRYCSRLGLPVTSRLDLLLAVCGAVQYAHRNLIVHRDLKPSNILVTAGGVPKLLDFGIAKLLDPASRDLTVTLAAARRLTPEFASPEQLRGEAVTTAGDVYALGALLYLLLTGRPPHRAEGRSFAAILQAVCETEPELPSTLVRRLGSATDWRVLRGDLDNIVSMALEKNPERRYSSVEQLAEDLRRYREGLPVAARSGGFGYRAGKFLRRRRKLVLATGLLLVLGIGLAYSMVAQARRTTRALGLAETESRRAEKVLQVLVDQFQIADPSESRGDTITAREVLERGAVRIREELVEQPGVQAELLHTVGQVHHNLGLYEQAADLMAQALAIRREVAGAGTPDGDSEIAGSLYGLAAVRHELGDYDRAVTLHREALDLRRRQFGEDHLKVAESLDGLAISLQNQSDYEAAEQHLRRALEIHQLHVGEDHELMARTLRHLGFLLWERGDYSAAEPLLRQALSLLRATLGEEHLAVADVLDTWAVMAYGKGDYELAEVRFRQVLALRRKLGADHPDMAVTLNNLCALANAKGDPKAESLCREALAMRRRLLGDEHPDVATTLNNLALVIHQKGNHDEAERLYRETLALNRKLVGEEHWRVAGNLNNLALLLHDRGDLDAAEPLFREALAMYRKLLGDEHPYAGFSLNNLARLFHDRGDYPAAEEMYREALALRRAALPEGHPQIASSATWLGKLYVDRGEPRRGEPLLLEALEIRRTSLAAGDWRTAEAESLLGDCLAALGRFDQAEPLLVDSYPVLLARRGATDRRALQAVERGVSLYQRWGKTEEAERFRKMIPAPS